MSRDTVFIFGGYMPSGGCHLTSEVYTYGRPASRYGPRMAEAVGGHSATTALNETHALVYGGRLCRPRMYIDRTYLVDIAGSSVTLVSRETSTVTR